MFCTKQLDGNLAAVASHTCTAKLNSAEIIMSSTKTYKWFKVAESIDTFEWKQNNMCVVETGGKKISVAKYNDQIFAFAYKCPHAGGVLADG